jgi:hypothetical protein
MDIKIPGERKLPAVLPQVAERQVYGNGEDYESDDGQNVARSFHSRIVGFYRIFVNAHVRRGRALAKQACHSWLEMIFSGLRADVS